jgi:hypothetical protein
MSAPTTQPSPGISPTLALGYTTRDKQRRLVLVGVDASQGPDVWSVYDVPAEGWLVARLDGYDEKAAHAESLARDYHGAQVAYHTGERTEDPLPNPTVIPMAVIGKSAALARRLLKPATEGPLGPATRPSKPRARKEK